MNDELVHPEMSFSKELRFTPYAWAKLIHMRDKGNTEVAGYGITETSDPLLITDFVLVKQECTMVTFKLDPDDTAEHMERMMDRGLMPWQYANILIHTHPGSCPTPSRIDEENFADSFSRPNWAVMFIIAEEGKTYSRLKVNVGPGTITILEAVVEFGVEFSGSDTQAWDKEYTENVFCETFKVTGRQRRLVPDSVVELESSATSTGGNSSLWWNEEEARYQRVTPEEQQRLEYEAKIDEMDCYWDGIDGDAVCWAEGHGGEKAYFYNPDTKKWRVDDGHDMFPTSPPVKGGLASRIIAWAAKNVKSRPDVEKATV